ncbi:DeoR/GlpR family DNA-binding transcription regulator [Bacillus sp. CMF12]|uniref:DeoR/GlpR family DNA-binding transcription regulator n=1 Tax=Bacillaceae TaxID=186817 RepID=UPI001FB1EE08|nr:MULTISPECIES: DeoR/GlpR family DNA-binding transcription regulator [Bacillaceae]UOE56731.1 DeoR/GlpR transcriptional regulator [Cytobacillus oceanisediminis]USK51220.1 DeoR/GlpR family DNA-binding transcription regulator [Bacillus sp. CMF12]
MSVLPEERKNEILKELKKTGKVKVVELVEQFQVSEETIRRDLMILEEKGLLKRVYGGAIHAVFQSEEPPFLQRTTVNQDAKVKVGKKAVELISDGDVISIDVGTTMLEFAKQIEKKKDITIITNSLPVSSVLTESINQNMFTGQVLLLGGQIDPKHQSICGSFTEQMLNQFNIDKAFISAGGFSIQKGVSNYHLHETLVSRKMVEVSKQVILLTDSSKIGVDTFSKVCPLEKIDVVVCEHPFPEVWKDHQELGKMNWIQA